MIAKKKKKVAKNRGKDRRRWERDKEKKEQKKYNFYTSFVKDIEFLINNLYFLWFPFYSFFVAIFILLFGKYGLDDQSQWLYCKKLNRNNYQNAIEVTIVVPF